jgi:hypothetical protein
MALTPVKISILIAALKAHQLAGPIIKRSVHYQTKRGLVRPKDSGLFGAVVSYDENEVG